MVKFPSSKLLGVGDNEDDFSDDGLAGLSEGESADGNEDGGHERLLDAIATLGGKKRVKPPVRSEPSARISEFHLSDVKGDGGNEEEEDESSVKQGAVKLSDLARVLGGKVAHTGLKKQLKAVTRHGKTLPKPLEKPEAERIERTTGFDKAKKEVSRWNGVVYGRRAADQLTFPLNKPDVRMQTTKVFLDSMKPKTPLEIELAKVLGGLDQPEPEEESKPTMLSLAEAMEQRKEMAKMRARQKYMETKARRQNKIKSKKYHRLLRRQKVKQQMTDFEKLQKSDPEAALEKLEQMEVIRAEERASLRHRNTSKWARNQAIRAKYNRESRHVLSEQLKISRDLTQKVKHVVSSEDEGVGEENETMEGVPSNLALTEADKSNPWLSGSLIDSSVKEFVSGFKKFQEKKQYEEEENSENETEGNTTGYVLEETSVNTDSTPVEDGRGNLPVKKKKAKELIKEETQEGGRESTNKIISKEVEQTGESKPMKKKRKNRKGLQEKVVQSREKVEVAQKRKKGTTEDVMEEAKGKKKLKKEKGIKNNSKNGTVQSEVNTTSKSKRKSSETLDIDVMFDKYEESVRKEFTEKLAKHRKSDGKEETDEENEEENEESDIDKDVVLPLRADRSKQGDLYREELDVQSKVNERVEEPQIDPTKFVRPARSKTKTVDLQSEAPKILGDGDEDARDDLSDGEEDSTRTAIAEAFADDDVVAEFREEKTKIVEGNKPKDIDLFLPGWGGWAGHGVKVSQRKRKRFIMKRPPAPPRRDDNKGDVIINEEKNTKVKVHQVSQLPFPFERVADFEASIRAPIGRTWLTETAHKKLTAPKVVTRAGAIIEPMGEEVLANRPKRKSAVHYRKNKKKEVIDAPAKIDV